MPRYLRILDRVDERTNPNPLLLSAAMAGNFDGVLCADDKTLELIRKQYSHNFAVNPAVANGADVVVLPAGAVVSPESLMGGGPLTVEPPTAFSCYEWFHHSHTLTQNLHGVNRAVDLESGLGAPADVVYLTKFFDRKGMALALRREDDGVGTLLGVGSSLTGQTTWEPLGRVKYSLDESKKLEDFDGDLFRHYTVTTMTYVASKGYWAARKGPLRAVNSYVDKCWGEERAELNRLGRSVPQEIDLFYANLRAETPHAGGRATPQGFVSLGELL